MDINRMLSELRMAAVYWQAMKTHKLLAAVAGLLYVSPGHAQSGKGPFQIMETTMDDVHAAYKSGKLTVHQLVQSYLNRINAYDKQGPRINSIITLNPSRQQRVGAKLLQGDDGDRQC
jgi:hypothetical protein